MPWRHAAPSPGRAARRRWLLAVLGIFLVACGSGGGGGGGTGVTLVGRFLLAVTLDSVVVHELPSMRALAYAPIADSVRGAAFDPEQRFLFVLTNSSGSPAITVFALDESDGALTEVAGSPFAMPAGADSDLVVDALGDFLYVGGAGVHAFTIDESSGALTAVAGSPFSPTSAINSFAVEGTGNFLFAALSVVDQVKSFAIERSDGSLSELPTSPIATGDQPETLAVHPNQRLLYVANAVSDDVSAFAIGSGGALMPLADSPFATGDGPLDVELDTTGRFLFTANESGASVSSFSVDSSSGNLTPAPSGSPSAGLLANRVAVDPDQTTVYAAASGSHHLRGFALDVTDADLVATRTARTRNSPVDLFVVSASERAEILPTFAYAASRFGPAIEAFSIEPDTGLFVELASSPIALSVVADSLASDPFGRFLYGGHQSGGIDAFTIASNGDLSTVLGSPFAPGIGIKALTGEPSGRFLYAASASLHAFAIDATSGALAALPGSPYDLQLGGPLTELSVDPTGRALYVRAGGTTATCAIDSDSGVPTLLPSSGFATPNARGFGVLGNGRFVCIPTSATDELTRYPTLAASAAFQVAGALVVPTEPVPTGIVVHPSDRWLFLPHSNGAAGAVSAFEIAEVNGVPTETAASPFSDGNVPAQLRLEQSGRWLYALNGNVVVTYFEIDPLSGDLTARGAAEPGLVDPLDLVTLARIQ